MLETVLCWRRCCVEDSVVLETALCCVGDSVMLESVLCWRQYCVEDSVVLETALCCVGDSVMFEIAICEVASQKQLCWRRDSVVSVFC